MELSLAQRVGRIKPSPTLAVTAKAGELKAQGKDVYSLSAGVGNGNHGWPVEFTVEIGLRTPATIFASTKSHDRQRVA